MLIQSMSEFTISDSIASHVARTLNEEFFDEHPNPADIERVRISDTIVVYADQYQASKTFLVEIIFPMTKHMKSSDYKQIKYSLELLRNCLKYTEVICYRDRNKLFLRKLFL